MRLAAHHVVARARDALELELVKLKRRQKLNSRDAQLLRAARQAEQPDAVAGRKACASHHQVRDLVDHAQVAPATFFRQAAGGVASEGCAPGRRVSG